MYNTVERKPMEVSTFKEKNEEKETEVKKKKSRPRKSLIFKTILTESLYQILIYL